ncbi:MAG: hypothetical protein U0228_14790 [Myxococcaceae bacterium]
MLSLLAALLVTASPDAGPVDAGVLEDPPTFPMLPKLAKAMEPKVKAKWVKDWLGQVGSLQHVEPATFFCTKDKQRCERARPDAGADWVERVADDEFVYARVTDPIAYARPFDLLAEKGFSPQGKKVLDFGYGNLGQLAMLARLGADVHGVEVDALLPASTAKVTGKIGTGSHSRCTTATSPATRAS